jgi:hypothetical protein
LLDFLIALIAIMIVFFNKLLALLLTFAQTSHHSSIDRAACYTLKLTIARMGLKA